MTRVFVPGLEKKAGGPRAFFRALVPALARLGIETAGGLGLRTDLALVSPFCRAVTLWWIHARGLPIVHRLDGIHYAHLSRFNAPMRDVYRVARVCVFQSEFSRRIVSAHFGKPKGRSRVIKNGTDLSLFYPADREPDLRALGLVASALWRPQKRLRDCLEILTAAQRVFPRVTLTVLGDTSRVPSEVRDVPGVRYLGMVSAREVAQILRESHVFLHPSWFDPCPNAVVEALASGLPVIYTRNGGTRELVPAGCGVELCHEPDFDLFETDIYNYERIPRVDHDEAVAALEEIVENYERYRRRIAEFRPAFSVENAASAYAEVFEEGLAARRSAAAAGARTGL